MSVTRISLAGGSQWIDVVDPSRRELDEIGKEFGLHSTSIQDCLDPTHLPKLERVGDVTFVITRAYDQNCSPDADSVQELTRKVALFRGKSFLITVHRKDQPFLKTLRTTYDDASERDLIRLTADILTAVARTYEIPVEEATARIEELETRTFRGGRVASVVEDAYYLHRRASVMKRILRMTMSVIALQSESEPSSPYYRDSKDAADSIFFFADELTEKVKSLIDLHLSLESHRVNEVIRVLTIYSAFFMPLTFIASIYGMNFKFMPELDSPGGYPTALGMMLVTAMLVYFWFRKRGWLKSS